MGGELAGAHVDRDLVDRSCPDGAADRAPMGVVHIGQDEATADPEVRFGRAVPVVVVEDGPIVVEVGRRHVEVQRHGRAEGSAAAVGDSCR